MSKNAPREITEDDFEFSVKAIKKAYKNFNNGYTVTEDVYRDVVEALRTLKRLPALIEYYVGVEDENNQCQ